MNALTSEFGTYQTSAMLGMGPFKALERTSRHQRIISSAETALGILRGPNSALQTDHT